MSRWHDDAPDWETERERDYDYYKREQYFMDHGYPEDRPCPYCGEPLVMVYGGSRGRRDSLNGIPNAGPRLEPDEPPEYECENEDCDSAGVDEVPL